MVGRKRKLPRGVGIRKYSKSESIQIAFSYKGVECRESLRMEPTPSNIRYAERLRNEILAEIERGVFSYPEKFPESKRAEKFGFNTSKPYMSTLLNNALKIKSGQIKPSSLKMYESALNTHLLPAFGHLRIDHINPLIIRDWFLESNLAAKTLRTHRILLDFALDLAVQDGLIDKNPSTSLRLEHILPKTRLVSTYKPDPLNKAEIVSMINAASEWFRPMITVWFFTGMRPGELIALTWDDINFDDQYIDINKSHVLGNTQTPKTDNSVRLIDMLPPVYEALKEQKKKTFLIGGEKGHVFRFEKSKKCFKDHRNLTRYVWKPTISRAGIRYRNQYQARHTFASQMLTEGNDPWWLAQQLGHKGVEMINRVYGQWIPENSGKRYQPKGDWSKLVRNLSNTHI